MGRSALIAAFVVVALALWMLSGQLGSGESEEESPVTAEEEKPATLMKVQTRVLNAELITREVVVQGQLEPVKVISVRAETAGNIDNLFAEKGQRIGRGQSIARMAIDTRNSDLAVAKANLSQAESEYRATQKLQKQGLQSKISLETIAAKREAARAQVQSAEMEIANTEITASIDGFIEDVHVKEGDFIDHGATVATLIDNSQLLVTGRIPQQRVADVKTGQTATVKLVTGQQIDGQVSYISSMADATRSFKIEVLIAQPPAGTLTGISGQLSIPVETIRAHRVSPAMLSLDDNGALGIKAVATDNTVTFHKIEVVKTENNGAWVTGLPDNATVITLGQGFVNPGEEVDPVPSDNEEPANSALLQPTAANRVAKL